MAKSNKRIPQHIGGSKGNLFVERLKSSNLEKMMVVPIEIGKSYHKALIADYFGSVLKEPFEFHSSQEGINFLHNTISKVSKGHQAEKILLGLEATGHYYKKPAASIHELGYNNLFVLNPLSTAQSCKAGLTWSKTETLTWELLDRPYSVAMEPYIAQRNHSGKTCGRSVAIDVFESGTKLP